MSRQELYMRYAAACLLISFIGIGIVAFACHWALGVLFVSLVAMLLAHAASSCAKDEGGSDE